MKFGEYEVFTIETGDFALDGGAMFGVVPKVLWNRVIPCDDKNRIPMVMRTLLIRYKDRTILVDTGIGTKNNEKFHKIYGIDLSKNTLTKSLAEHGVTPADITDVIQTHLHFDHAGGAVELEADGTPKLAFPNATYYVQRDHWDWANNPTDKDKASFLPQDFLPLKEYGKLELLNGEEELIPGLSLEIVHGHTKAQQLVRLTSGDQSLLYCADLIPTSRHVPAPYIMGYDIEPLVTLAEKQKTLEKAATDNTILVFEHDYDTEACTLEMKDGKYVVRASGELMEVIAEQ
ncbi:MAG: MBL fold metallo-hydrolase [Ectothiorhodospiraceae bacterium]|nr:MBL fold metallo-hydrolase [Ectothiorhodospiraceae bacterium]